MEKIRRILEGRKQYLLRLKREKEHALVNAPEGVLRVCCHGQRTQYYRRENEKDVSGAYLCKKDMDLVRMLAQKEYDQKVFRAVEKEMGAIERCLKGYPMTGAEEVYGMLHRERRKLVVPIRETDEEYVQHWEGVTYEGKTFEENVPEFYTAKNERVRSKSEWIIADMLNKEGVPYRYECPLKLKGMGMVYPDFQVLNVKLRKEFYWEHLGMMDDPEYVERALQRLKVYEQNGFYPGENLIVSFETRTNPLNQKEIMNKITHYLK